MPPDPDDPFESRTTGPLEGRTVAITAERRSSDQADLFRARGATVVHAPTMHTLDLADDEELRRLTSELIESPPDWTVATTGYGMRLWFEAADGWGVGDALLTAMAKGQVVARGPKARSACRRRDVEVAWQAPNESMPEVVDWMRTRPGIAEATIAVQLFDPEDHPTTVDLRSIARRVVAVPIYRWRHPDDRAPAFDLIDRIVERSVDAVTFTSQPAVRFLFEMATEVNRPDEVVAAFESGDVLPVCIGPVCAEALVEAGITTSVWPEPFRLVPMVKLATERLLIGT